MPALAQNLMNTEVVSVRPYQTLREAALALVEYGVSGCPVVDDDGIVVGVISQTDLVHARAHGDVPVDVFYNLHEKLLLRPGEASMAEEALDGAGRDDIVDAEDSGLTVADVMNTTLYAVDADDDVKTVADAMTTQGVHRLLVMREGRLVGMISAMDLVAHMAGRDRRR